MKYMIHACPQRMWYVADFLIPSMIEQGISREDIFIWNDEKKMGNLVSFTTSMKFVAEAFPENEAIWHLQDDIMISERFKEITHSCPPEMVCNGACLFDKKFFPFFGRQPIYNRWLSFQAIQIPNKYAKEFSNWWENGVVKNGMFEKRRAENKYDDYFFWQFMIRFHKYDIILNIAPNIVQHIDYMIGGTTLKNQEYKRISRCYYWFEEDREEQLKQKLKEGGKHGETEN